MKLGYKLIKLSNLQVWSHNHIVYQEHSDYHVPCKHLFGSTVEHIPRHIGLLFLYFLVIRLRHAKHCLLLVLSLTILFHSKLFVILAGKVPEVADSLLCDCGHALFETVVTATNLFVFHFHVAVNHYLAEGLLEPVEKRGTCK